jgi:hypothetical protein
MTQNAQLPAFMRSVGDFRLAESTMGYDCEDNGFVKQVLQEKFIDVHGAAWNGDDHGVLVFCPGNILGPIAEKFEVIRHNWLCPAVWEKAEEVTSPVGRQYYFIYIVRNNSRCDVLVISRKDGIAPDYEEAIRQHLG